MTEEQAARTSWREYDLRRRGLEKAQQEEWEFLRFPWEEPESEELKRKAEEYRVSPEEAAELNRIFQEIEAAKVAKKHKEGNV